MPSFSSPFFREVSFTRKKGSLQRTSVPSLSIANRHRIFPGSLPSSAVSPTQNEPVEKHVTSNHLSVQIPSGRSEFPTCKDTGNRTCVHASCPAFVPSFLTPSMAVPARQDYRTSSYAFFWTESKRTNLRTLSQLHGATSQQRNDCSRRAIAYAPLPSVGPGQKYPNGIELRTKKRASEASPQGDPLPKGNGGRTPSEPTTASGPSRFRRKSTTAPKRFATGRSGRIPRC